MTRLSFAAERLGRREAGRRWPVLALPGVLLLVLTPLLMGQGRPAAKVVEAERFVLRDAAGTVLAELRPREGGPSLELHDKDGRTRVLLTVAADGASELRFQDRDGRRRAGLQ